MSRSRVIGGMRSWSRFCLRSILANRIVTLAVVTLGVVTLSSLANAQNVEVALSSRIEVNGLPYSGDVVVKVVIIDNAVTSLWSNDNSSVAGSEPISSFTVAVTDSVFTLHLGSGDTDLLPGSLFDGTSPLFVILWMDAGEGLQRFDPLPLTTVPRAVSALRLGGRPASDYLTNSSTILIGNSNLSESISNENLQAFSDSGNVLTIGDGAALSDKEFRVATGGVDDPVLRYNIATSSWQFSNDGLNFLELDDSSATSFIGSGSLTTAVDLDTDETAGILPISKGGTGADTPALARDALGLEIGADVQAFMLHNLSANVAPTATDDTSLGYSIGSVWIDTLAAQSYIAVDVSLGAAIWQVTSFVPAPGGQSAPHPITNRKLAWSFPIATNSTAFTSVGMTNPTVTAAGTAQPALPGATRMYIRYATTAVVNNTNGIRGPLTQTRPAFRPTYSTVIRTDSSVFSRRIWIGLSSAELAALPTDTVGAPASTASFVAIAYDTTGNGNNTDWLCCSGDSASYSCVSTGVSVAIETEYTMVVDWSALGSLTCSVNGTSVTKLSNLSTATVNIGPYSSVRTLSPAIANHFIAKQSLEQN